MPKYIARVARKDNPRKYHYKYFQAFDRYEARKIFCEKWKEFFPHLIRGENRFALEVVTLAHKPVKGKAWRRVAGGIGNDLPRTFAEFEDTRTQLLFPFMYDMYTARAGFIGWDDGDIEGPCYRQFRATSLREAKHIARESCHEEFKDAIDGHGILDLTIKKTGLEHYNWDLIFSHADSYLSEHFPNHVPDKYPLFFMTFRQMRNYQRSKKTS